MALSNIYVEDRARDALLFEPLPSMPWLSITDEAIIITVLYSEQLSRLLGRLPKAKWDAANQSWKYPFSSADAIRGKMAEIDELASQAHDKRERENEIREARRAVSARLAENARLQKQENFKVRPIKLDRMVAEGPIYDFAVESIGESIRQSYGGPRPCWVAQIVGHDGRKWVRAYLNGRRDYAGANSKGSRGVITHFDLMRGPIYQISVRFSWRGRDQYFARIENGLIKMTEEEVLTCLEK